MSQEGGHGKAAPEGLEYHLPYQTSIVISAGLAETLLSATRRTSNYNDLDLTHNWRNTNRRVRAQSCLYDWIKHGSHVIDGTIGN